MNPSRWPGESARPSQEGSALRQDGDRRVECTDDCVCEQANGNNECDSDERQKHGVLASNCTSLFVRSFGDGRKNLDHHGIFPSWLVAGRPVVGRIGLTQDWRSGAALASPILGILFSPQLGRTTYGLRSGGLAQLPCRPDEREGERVAIPKSAEAHDWSYRTVGVTALLLGACLVLALADRLLGPWRLPEGPIRSIDSMALGSVVLSLVAIGARHRAASDRLNTVTGYMLGVIGGVVIPVDLALGALGASADSVLALSLVSVSRLALIALAAMVVFPERRTGSRIGHRILGMILGVFIAGALVSVAARAAEVSITTLNDAAFAYPAALMILISLPFGASSIRRRQPQGLILAFTLIAFAVADVHWMMADSLAGASSRLMRFVALGGILVLTVAELRDLALHERAESLRAQNESERAADRLVAQLSIQERFVHDTRNALLAIQGGLRSLIDESNTAMVSAVSSEVDRLRTLLDTSESDPLPRNFDLVEAIQPMVACYAASGHDISLMAEGRVMARGRPSMTAEIAQNLIENAIHYGSSGDIAIWVLSKGDFAEVRVADRGLGVDIDLRDAIFERGISGGSSSGVGLHISRRLVESQGGSLTLSDRHGGGTIFSFTVPIGGHTPQARALDLTATR